MSGARAARGFSLLELAVVLTIISAVGLLFWQLMPRLRSLPVVVGMTSTSLGRAQTALDGFVLANGRLPCPDTTGGGSENCSVTDTTGWLPVRTLGISLPERVRYGVYRDAAGNVDLASPALVDRYAPLLPPGSTSNQVNGLDFCQGLLGLTRAAPTAVLRATLGATTVPIVYGLAVAGAADADGDGNVFDGTNIVASQFAASGTPHSASYDDDTLTIGGAELFTRLGCATRIAEANGAARVSFAAYDIDRFAQMFVTFRTFQVEVRQMNEQNAEEGVALATVDLAVAIAAAANAAALAAESAGIGAPLVAAAALAITAATAALTAAVLTLQSAQAKVIVAMQQEAAAKVFQALTAADALAAVSRAQALDTKGLLP